MVYLISLIIVLVMILAAHAWKRIYVESQVNNSSAFEHKSVDQERFLKQKHVRAIRSQLEKVLREEEDERLRKVFGTDQATRLLSHSIVNDEFDAMDVFKFKDDMAPVVQLSYLLGKFTWKTDPEGNPQPMVWNALGEREREAFAKMYFDLLTEQVERVRAERRVREKVKSILLFGRKSDDLVYNSTAEMIPVLSNPRRSRVVAYIHQSRRTVS